MIRRPPRSTQSRSSAASDVYKRQVVDVVGVLPDIAGEDGLELIGEGSGGIVGLDNLELVVSGVLDEPGPSASEVANGGGGEDLLKLIEGTEGSVDLLEAVSYTHLRAHETVLDLVCRLLLEKKKQQYT
eukprot:TRINITY_DN10293_c0_g1_i1.p1 TRINITY_DN10293_c0_g1~~TRINITY_DN10293_c0_g1_i1.p1  ORF type:complete len:129 (+),score=72.53 TRINITY_DN10293_c0_g1_i1:136-522(+)